MNAQSKRWYTRWWFALVVFLLGLFLGSLIPDGWLASSSGITFWS